MQKKSTKTPNSRFLSLILRHKPELIGLELDPQGWVSVDTLLKALQAHGRTISPDALEDIVQSNNKQRFAFSADGTHIRASQGHSVPVELGYTAQTPPDLLYHGTAERFLAAILAEGLIRQRRHHVHLSLDLATAAQVGNRHGKLVILTIQSGQMAQADHSFYRSENGVWLTESVPPTYISRYAS